MKRIALVAGVVGMVLTGLADPPRNYNHVRLDLWPEGKMPVVNTVDEYFKAKAAGAKRVLSDDPVALRKAVYDRVEATCRAQMGLGK